jgi:hypothetical protein
MVATITTLVSGFAGDYFTSLAKEDYYLSGGEPPGRWRGAGAVALGLEGIVDQTSFKNLLAGLRADGRELDRRAAANDKRVPGYDLTFSAPKSVSALCPAGSPAANRNRLRRRRQLDPVLAGKKRSAGASREGGIPARVCGVGDRPVQPRHEPRRQRQRF